MAQLSAAAASYVRFSVEEPALFSALFGAGVTKSRFPALAEASRRAYRTWLGAARALTQDDEAATDLAVDVLTVAHGYAALLADGQFGPPGNSVTTVEARVRSATSALLHGRTA